ncbi:MAG: CHASE2 domain-containing protein [Cyanobacteriota bacterium]|nr:CHASE2 domain-containing protein [Cyanobacteriota bacterium]
MRISAILEIDSGSFEEGFPVTLKIQENGVTRISKHGCLPPSSDIFQTYESWKSIRYSCGFDQYRVIEEITDEPTNIKISEISDRVKFEIDEWLNSGDRDFRAIRDEILGVMRQSGGDVRLLVQTDEIRLWKLPWHLWGEFDRYRVEPTFSALNYQKHERIDLSRSKTKVRILAILGDSTDIDTEADLVTLKDRFKGKAEIVTLVATNSAQLNDRLWEQNWDILFFAGHSTSNLDYTQGLLQLNETESITIADNLKYGLRKAIARGLKLAIFNSCDGLGLARELSTLQIPAIIVMRERIPDEVAQKFLEYFLHAFANRGESLHASVRTARERLYELEDKYPCASWLPVVFAHPSWEPLTWQGLLAGDRPERRRVSLWRTLQGILLASTAVTGTIVGARWGVGILQPTEQLVHDFTLRRMPDRGEDPRLLLVKITEDDLSKYAPNGMVLPDEILAQALAKLQSHQPRVIGLNIIRDLPVGNGYDTLAAQLERENLVTTCEVGSRHDDRQGHRSTIASPPASPEENRSYHDIAIDADGVVRRHLFFQHPSQESKCEAQKALSLLLALRYLEVEDIPTQLDGYLKLGDIVFKPLDNNTGFYHNLDDAGHQVLLDYRSQERVARTISLDKLLNSEFEPEWITDRIIIMGTDAPTSYYHRFKTPYNSWEARKLSGVVLHAHMTSQLLGIATNDRPLLRFLPRWGDILLVFVSSVAGGILVLCLKSPLSRNVGGTIAIVVSYAGYFLVFSVGGVCLPFVPMAIALVATATIAASSMPQLRYRWPKQKFDRL